MNRNAALPSAALLLLTGPALAQVQISEVFINPPGADNGQEFVELRGAPGGSLDGITLLVIEGDGTTRGVVDQAIDLTGLSLGANGLLLIRDDADVLAPAPEAATSVAILDFVPDLENGSNTFALATGTVPALGTDLDTDNDDAIDAGVLDPSFAAIDAFTLIDGAGDGAYADDLGFPGAIVGPFAFVPDALVRIFDADGAACGVVGGDVVGTDPGPYDLSLTANAVFGGISSGFGPQTLSPGSTNAGLSLLTDVPSADALTGGGTQNLTLCAGTANALDMYLILLSATGTGGFQCCGAFSVVTVPLDFDMLSLFSIEFANSATFVGTLGTLSGNGRASAALVVPPAPSSVGLRVFSAAIVFDPTIDFAAVFASTPAPLDLL